jgi:hypothetical protein
MRYRLSRNRWRHAHRHHRMCDALAIIAPTCRREPHPLNPYAEHEEFDGKCRATDLERSLGPAVIAMQGHRAATTAL